MMMIIIAGMLFGLAATALIWPLLPQRPRLRAAAFDGKEWLVMSACKAHDCAAHRIAVLYDPKDGAMHGVLSG